MKLHPSYQALAETLEEKHGPKLDRGRALAELIRIQHLSKDVASLVDKRVLDLGCGSVKNRDSHWNPITRFIQQWTDPATFARFQPWYCRILHEAGAHPVGIDIRNNKKEPFESHVMDLTKPESLEQFPEASFDHANNFFLSVPKHSMYAKTGTSPGMWLSLAWKHRLDNYRQAQERDIPLESIRGFYEELNLKRIWNLNNQIFHQVERLLKEGGVYTLAEFAYRKKQGVLMLEKKMPI